MSGKVRVRFAPSPTGPLHVGGVRTALYNYLFARKHNGNFILRIEDTDQNRFVPGAEEYIIESLKWCGIMPDEGQGFGDGPYAPYRQSERKEIYRKYAEQLISTGHAYYAFDKEEELTALRTRLEAEKSSFSYNAQSRKDLVNSISLPKEESEKRIAAGEPYVIRLKVPENEEIHVMDLIRGDVSVHTSQMDDKVLFKSDGMPTYHLANVVDDYLMKITHVIRGEEWLPSAPLHVLLYRSFGWENVMPAFAHLPLLLKPDGNGKLSKRDGDRLGFPVFPLQWTDPVTKEVSSGYREKGYYPDAFINMLALLGWHPSGDKEIYSMEELIQDFSLERVNKAGAKFDPEKTKWFNQHYLRLQPDKKLAGSLKQMLGKEFGFSDSDRRMQESYLVSAVSLLKDRVHFEHEMTGTGRYLFLPPDNYDEQVIAKKWKDSYAEFFSRLVSVLEEEQDFTSQTLETKFQETAAGNGLKAGEVLQLFRVFISGQGSGVNLFGMIELLGKEEVTGRLKKALVQVRV